MRRALWLAIGIGSLVPAVVFAQVRLEGDGRQREGEYGGVEPGGTAKPGYEFERQCGNRRDLLTWIGFQEREGGGSRLFVQLCGELAYDQAMVGNKLVVSLPGARFESTNARRALDMRFFDTVLQRAAPSRSRGRGKRSRRRAAGISISISFKDAADAREASASIDKSKDGYTYLFLDFGPPANPTGRRDSIRPAGDDDVAD